MSQQSYYSRPLRILLVDDEASVRQVFSRLFEADGHIVGVATNGAEGLAQFQASTWDVVVTDRRMPELDGSDLAKEIKQLSPSTPVIMTTGFVLPGACENADVVLRKPFKKGALPEAISACLDKLTAP